MYLLVDDSQNMGNQLYVMRRYASFQALNNMTQLDCRNGGLESHPNATPNGSKVIFCTNNGSNLSLTIYVEP